MCTSTPLLSSLPSLLHSPCPLLYLCLLDQLHWWFLSPSIPSRSTRKKSPDPFQTRTQCNFALRTEYLINKYGKDKDKPNQAGLLDNLYCESKESFCFHSFLANETSTRSLIFITWTFSFALRRRNTRTYIPFFRLHFKLTPLVANSQSIYYIDAYPSKQINILPHPKPCTFLHPSPPLVCVRST